MGLLLRFRSILENSPESHPFTHTHHEASRAISPESGPSASSARVECQRSEQRPRQSASRRTGTPNHFHPMIKFYCPHCNAKISAEAEFEGQTSVCPSCGESMTVPRSENMPAASPPIGESSSPPPLPSASETAPDQIAGSPTEPPPTLTGAVGNLAGSLVGIARATIKSAASSDLAHTAAEKINQGAAGLRDKINQGATGLRDKAADMAHHASNPQRPLPDNPQTDRIDETPPLSSRDLENTDAAAGSSNAESPTRPTAKEARTSAPQRPASKWTPKRVIFTVAAAFVLLIVISSLSGGSKGGSGSADGERLPTWYTEGRRALDDPNTTVACSKCNGVGRYGTLCRRCKGYGTISTNKGLEIVCPTCAGDGGGYPCNECGGSGRVKLQRR